MATLAWDELRDRTYDYGLDHGVFYIKGSPGVIWPGLVRIDISNTNFDAESVYFDGRKFKTIIQNPNFEATLVTRSKPEGFIRCEGLLELAPGLFASNQPAIPFGFSYRSLIGSAAQGKDFAYKLHMVYNAIAAPEALSYSTLNVSMEPMTYQFKLRSVPYNTDNEFIWFDSSKKFEKVPSYYPLDAGPPYDELGQVRKRTAYPYVSNMIVDSRSVNPQSLRYLEQILYGTDHTEPELPSPADVIEILR